MLNGLINRISLFFPTHYCIPARKFLGILFYIKKGKKIKNYTERAMKAALISQQTNTEISTVPLYPIVGIEELFPLTLLLLNVTKNGK